MCMRLCVCTYARICAGTYERATYTSGMLHARVRRYGCAYPCTSADLCVSLYLCTHLCMCMYTCQNMQIHIFHVQIPGTSGPKPMHNYET